MATQSANGLLAVWTDIAPEAESEFNEWYNTEHIPQLLGGNEDRGQVLHCNI